MTSSPFFVHGIALVNTGGELCDACGKRKAVGASVSGHLLCVRCAGWAAKVAEEYAQEVEASRLRRTAEHERNRAIIRAANERINATVTPATHARRRRAGQAAQHFRCGHSKLEENVHIDRRGAAVCRTCARERVRVRRASMRRTG